MRRLLITFLICGICSLYVEGQPTTYTPGAHNIPSSAITPYSINKNADTVFFTKIPVRLNTIYYNHLGFMCKQELKLEKIAKTSIRFRLGTVTYTDKMEKKNIPITLQ